MRTERIMYSMKLTFKGANVYRSGCFKKLDITVENGIISSLCPSGASVSDSRVSDFVFNLDNCFVFPGLTDVHVHLREPGFSYKETVRRGTLAGARGGFATLCTMPNLSPAPDCAENLKAQTDIIREDAVINVVPLGTITMGRKGTQVSKIEEMVNDVCGFTDDGSGVNDTAVMREAMLKVKEHGSIIAEHCEIASIANKGAINDCEFARVNGISVSHPSAEYEAVKDTIELSRQTGCPIHICHVSTKESVEYIRQAKRDGINITAETAPHYFAFCDDELVDSGNFRMNPPIRSKRDRDAIIEGLKDGTLDMIATDHAPHSFEEKSGGLESSLSGVVGLETAFAASYTYLVKAGHITLERLIELMAVNPCKRFSLPYNEINVGEPASFAAADLSIKGTVDPDTFISLGRSTPFTGKKLYSDILITLHNGRIVWCDEWLKRKSNLFI
ncbi:MAG: dihydroorotase [Clostridiales bacterium]|nr:dihydroorotase [Clostridiales bacterium]